jgi:hypothetical protein
MARATADNPALARWPEALLALAVALWLIPVRHAVLGHDVVWQLWLGRQMANGVGLYSELVEVNPPLWFWLGEALTRPGMVIGQPGSAMLTGFFVAATAVSATLLALAVREARPVIRSGIYAGFVLVALATTLREFGQREHFAMLTTIPWVALVARRRAGLATSLPLGLAIGLFGAAGFALKHYFVLIPVLLEAWLLIAGGWRAWRLWRPELIALAASALAYVGAILAFAPAFVAEMLPMIGLAYGDFNSPFAVVLRNLGLPRLGLALVALVVIGRRPSPFAAASLVAALGFGIAYLLQAKGWHYHLIPVSGLVLLAIIPDAVRALVDNPSWRTRGGAAIAGVLALWAAVTVVREGYYFTPARAATEAALAGVPAGQSVMIMSAYGSAPWPMVAEQRLLWPSRYFSLWMLPSITAAGNDARGAALARLAVRVRADTTHDLLCNPPERLLLDNATSQGWRPGFDYLAFFSADADFRALMTHYRRAPGSGKLAVYVLADPGGIRRPAGCRPIY